MMCDKSENSGTGISYSQATNRLHTERIWDKPAELPTHHYHQKEPSLPLSVRHVGASSLPAQSLRHKTVIKRNVKVPAMQRSHPAVRVVRCRPRLGMRLWSPGFFRRRRQIGVNGTGTARGPADDASGQERPHGSRRTTVLDRGTKQVMMKSDKHRNEMRLPGTRHCAPTSGQW